MKVRNLTAPKSKHQSVALGTRRGHVKRWPRRMEGRKRIQAHQVETRACATGLTEAQMQRYSLFFHLLCRARPSHKTVLIVLLLSSCSWLKSRLFRKLWVRLGRVEQTHLGM